jgi:NitT/TauT family transport system substrate-binding protein
MARSFGTPMWASSLAMLAVLACAPDAAYSETKVTIATANNAIGQMAYRLADSKGYFAAEGLKPEAFDFKGGGPAIQAVAGGGADMCICTGDHVIWLANHGIKTRILIAVTLYYSYGLVTRAASPFTDLKSLKGHSIGITSSGSSTDNMIRYAAKTIGLDADKDFTLIGAGTTAAMVPAIETGAVDAGMLTTPDFQSFMYRGKEKYRTVEDFTKVPYLTSSYVVTDDWLKKNPTTARGFARAVVRALELIHSDPDAVRGDLKQAYPQFDEPFTEQMVKLARRNLSNDGKLDETVWQSVNDILTKSDAELKPVPYADAVALEFLPTAK